MSQNGDNTIANYKSELDTLSKDIGRIISTRKNESIEQNNSILHEITENIEIISQGNNLLQIDKSSTTGSINDSGLIIDFESLPNKIEEFKSLLTSLVQLYLEQESLDQFLRITISDNKEQLLDIKSVKDSRFKNLENQVQILKEDNVDEREIEIDNLRKDISSMCQEVLSKEDKLNDLTTQLEKELTQCSDLLKELTEIHKIRNKKLTSLENKETKEIQQYEEFIDNFNNITNLSKEKDILQIEIGNWNNGNKKSKSTIDNTDTNYKQEIDILKENDRVVKKLIKIQEKHLLTSWNSNITDFKFIYQESKKEITFRCHEKYNVKININPEDNSFEGVNIQNINNNTTIEAVNQLANDINIKFYHDKNLFNIINYTSKMLINH